MRLHRRIRPRKWHLHRPWLCKSWPTFSNPHQGGCNCAMEPIKTSPLGLSTSQAAHALGVSLGTIRRWSDMGYLESYRTPGGQRRFSRDQIQEFIDSLQRGSRSTPAPVEATRVES